ncbi:hypothetical protein TSOC_008587 [Tetrabaena socialis]|uniref:Uncharacterized protein n=1 Tax=Tetrabaena socialis TaxID=47790 RepID=A0A2J7ZY26_9CHLO|nr:hypothetical protein TSOC_008587 [Tetrabaena socialis]|eukprot:PNH05171.1 hypothetical protein TSOC_008587 [Tetrabaena socialis]
MYNLRSRSSLPVAGTAAPATLPTGVRPRPANQKATWGELPIICKQLDPATVLSARGVAVAMREACADAPIQLRFTLPWQTAGWDPAQLEAWERRVAAVQALLSGGKLTSHVLQLRLAGAAAWKAMGPFPTTQMFHTANQMRPLVSSLAKLSKVQPPITELDVELPINTETLVTLGAALPGVSSLRLDSLIPPPNNHTLLLAESRAFPQLRKLDLCVTAWDHVQHLACLTQLTELKLRYSMWNIPELAPLSALKELETFSFEVLDDRARFQLDFLGPLVRGIPKLRHLRAAIIVSRSIVGDISRDSGPASFDFLKDSKLETLQLDVRVPQDAVRLVHGHFRNLHLVPDRCKVSLTLRSDGFWREVNFDSAASRTAVVPLPRLGMAHQQAPEPRERWGALNMDQGGHPADALSLHLRGYRGLLKGLPDLSAACLARLQISSARLGAADFVALAGCSSLEHLFVRFCYLPPEQQAAASAAAAGGSQEPQAARPAGSAAAPTMLTRSRRSLLRSGRASGGGGGLPNAVVPPQADCADAPVPYLFQPLLQLRKLRNLELLEQPEPTVAAGAAAGEGRPAAVAHSSRAGPSSAGAASSAAAASLSAEQAQAQPAARAPLPMSRSGMTHFLRGLAAMPRLSVSLALLAEEGALSDCPCAAGACFKAGVRGRTPPKPLLAERIDWCLLPCSRYQVVLGGASFKGKNWSSHRPSAWPELEA